MRELSPFDTQPKYVPGQTVWRLARVTTPVPCLICNSTGRVGGSTDGFGYVTIACPACHGKHASEELVPRADRIVSAQVSAFYTESFAERREEYRIGSNVTMYTWDLYATEPEAAAAAALSLPPVDE